MNSLKSFLTYILVIATAILAQECSDKIADGHCRPKPIVCYGPRGPRGHQGQLGERGARGIDGTNGADGTDAEDPGALDVVYLWSKFQAQPGPILFDGYNQTQGFTIDPTFEQITLQKGGVYTIFYYLRDFNVDFETYLDNVLIPAATIDQQTFTTDQYFRQFPIFAQPGQVLSFRTNNFLPFLRPSDPASVDSIRFSVFIQLISPGGSFNSTLTI